MPKKSIFPQIDNIIQGTFLNLLLDNLANFQDDRAKKSKNTRWEGGGRSKIAVLKLPLRSGDNRRPISCNDVVTSAKQNMIR